MDQVLTLSSNSRKRDSADGAVKQRSLKIRPAISDSDRVSISNLTKFMTRKGLTELPSSVGSQYPS